MKKYLKQYFNSIFCVVIALCLMLGVLAILPTKVYAEYNTPDFSTWVEVDALPTSAGSYKLIANVEMTGSWEVPTGTVNLCLNDHVVSFVDDHIGDYGVIVGEGSIFNLYDNGSTIHKYDTQYASWSINDGLGDDVPTTSGGVITGATAGGVQVAYGGEFNMYSGNIAANRSFAGGGGVCIGPEGKFTLYGGTLKGNYDNNNGGGVYLAGGTFTMNGGNIISNSAVDGGGIYAQSGTITLNDGVIDGNSQGIFLFDADLTMNGGTISNNDSDHGGAVRAYAYSTFTMNGGEITENRAYFLGGAVYVEGATFTLNDGLISNNYASDGGGVFVDISSIFTVEHGDETLYGTFIMHGGEISENYASSDGGGVFAEYNTTIVADGGAITENTSVGYGGGVFIDNENGDFYCIAQGTPITLANGTRKNIEELNVGDMVRVFDHDTGEISTSKIFYLEKKCDVREDVFTLNFSNDINVTVISGHCFFNKEENRYVNITNRNASRYIGKQFYNADYDRWETLTSWSAVNTPVNSYSIVTEKTINSVANGMLSCGDAIYYVLSNIFEYGENLQYDQIKKQQDISKYGLWDFADAQYATKETYDALNLKYIKVAFGKGLITPEQFAGAGQYQADNNSGLAHRRNKQKPTKRMRAATPDSFEYPAGLFLGGVISITNNLSIMGVTNNLTIFAGGNLITLGRGLDINNGGNGVLAPADGMTIEFALIKDILSDYATGQFTTNGFEAEKDYFTSENALVVYSNNVLMNYASYIIDNVAPEAFKETNNGYVAIETSAIAESTVTLKVVPLAGYKLEPDSLNATYYDGDGEEQNIILTSGEYNTYTFEMPDSTVIIDANFVPVSKSYDLWIAGIHVDEGNENDVLGDGTVSYDSIHNDIIFNNANISHKFGMLTEGVKIAMDSTPDIILHGNNIIGDPDYDNVAIGISSTKNVYFEGDGNLSIYCTDSAINGSLIYFTVGFTGDITIVSSVSGAGAIEANGAIYFNGSGNINIKATNGYGIESNNSSVYVDTNIVKIDSKYTGITGAYNFSVTSKIDIKVKDESSYAVSATTIDFDENIIVINSDYKTDDTTIKALSSENNNGYVTIRALVQYDVWVSEVQVDEFNLDDILGDGEVSYTPATATTEAVLTFHKSCNVKGIKCVGENITITSDANVVITLTAAILLGNNDEDITITIRGNSEAKTITFKPQQIDDVNNFRPIGIRRGNTLILDNYVILTDSNGTAFGGGMINVAANAKLIMNGGLIQNGTVTSTHYDNAGHYLGRGGAIYIAAGGEFTMNGGEIKNCSATVAGGAIFSAGILNIYGGKISNCNVLGMIDEDTVKAKGGAVYILSGEFTMFGGEITGNALADVDDTRGAGVYIAYDVDVTIGGTAYIYGNTAGDNENNLFLYDSVQIVLGSGTNAPDKTMCIGVNTKTAPTLSTPVQIIGACDENIDKCVFADNSNQYIEYDSNVLYLMRSSDVTFDPNFVISEEQLVYGDEWTITFPDVYFDEAQVTVDSFDYLYYEYDDEGECWVLLDSQPTNAGSYKVEYTVSDTTYTGKCEYAFIIEKAEATIDTTNVIDEYTYTGVEQAVTSGAVLNNSEGTLVYSDNTFTDAGDYTITISVAETANYKEATENVKITVNKTNATDNTTNVSLDYDGLDHANLAEIESVINIKGLNSTAITPTAKQYSVDGMNYAPGTDIDWDKIEAIDAGNYTVYYQYEYDNYATVISSFTLTINKIDATDNTSNVSLDYDGQDHANLAEIESVIIIKGLNSSSITPITTKYSVDGINYASGLDIDWSTIKAINVGSYVMYYQWEFDNYNTVEGSFTLTIVKAAQVVSISGNITKIYDSNRVYSPYYTKLGDGAVTIEYKLASEEDTAYTTVAPRDVGEYIVRVSVAEGTNYLAGSETLAFEITHSQINQVGFKAITAPVGAATATSSIEAPVQLKYSGEIEWSPALINGTFDYNTIYTATITLTVKSNYRFTGDASLHQSAGTGWVKSDDSTNTVIIYTKTFEQTGKAPQNIEITNDISKVFDGREVSAPTYTGVLDGTVTIEYKLVDMDDEFYSTSVPVNAGSYIVKVSASETTTSNAGSATKEFAITLATATDNTTNASLDYDGQDHANLAEIESVISIKGVGSTNITPAAKKYSVDGINYALGSDIDWSTTNAINVGNYKIYYQYEYTNYNTVNGSFTLSIDPKDIVITIVDVAAGTYAYDGTAKTTTATYTDLVGTDTLAYTLSYSDNVNAGTCVVTIASASITSANASNYNLVTTDTGTIVISKVKATNPTVVGTYKYTGNAQTVQLNGVESYMTTTDSLSQTQVGVYTINFSLDNNYEWATGSDGKVTWEIRAASITPESQEDKNKVVVETDAGFTNDIVVKVEVTIEVESKQLTVDYYNITNDDIKLLADEKVGVVFDVKLYTTIDGQQHEIQPNDIAPGTVLKVKILIPETIDINKVTRILHVHSANDIEEIEFDPAKVDADGYYEIEVSKLSEFAFIQRVDEAKCLWHIAGIVLLVVLIVFAVLFIINKFKEIKLVEILSKKVMLIISIALAALCLIFGLVGAISSSCAACIVFMIIDEVIAIAYIVLDIFLYDKIAATK